MQRVCFQLQVKPERIDEYKARHAAVWPDMLRALAESGWHNYSLFLRDDGLLIGYVETHDRPRTAALIEGLEVVPRAKLSYRGSEFEEMDLDAVLAVLADVDAPVLRDLDEVQRRDEVLFFGRRSAIPLVAGDRTILDLAQRHVLDRSEEEPLAAFVLVHERLRRGRIEAARAVQSVDRDEDRARFRGAAPTQHSLDARRRAAPQMCRDPEIGAQTRQDRPRRYSIVMPEAPASSRSVRGPSSPVTASLRSRSNFSIASR